MGMFSCSHQQVRPTEEEYLILTQAMASMPEDFSNPRLVTGELVVKLKDLRRLEGIEKEAANLKQGLPADQTPSLYIWSSDIVDHATQVMLPGSSIVPAPREVSSDPEYGNRVLFWTPSWGGSSELVITRRFRYITFDHRPVVDAIKERNHWNEIPGEILAKYTRSEPFLEQEEGLVDTVFHLLENVSDPVSHAHAIYNWVQEFMTYEYPPEERGVCNAFKTGRGTVGNIQLCS